MSRAKRFVLTRELVLLLWALRVQRLARPVSIDVLRP